MTEKQEMSFKLLKNFINNIGLLSSFQFVA